MGFVLVSVDALMGDRRRTPQHWRNERLQHVRSILLRHLQRRRRDVDSRPKMCIRNGASGLSFSLRHGREEFQYQDDKAWCHCWVTARRPLRQCWQVVLSIGGALAKDPQAADNICVCRGVSPVTGEPCAEFGSRAGLQ